MRTPARMVFYGGGAGGGKSYGGKLLALRWRHIRGYRCGFFRIDRPRLTQEGGMWDESKSIYPYFGAVPNESRLEWVFPSGAKIKFNGLQGDYKLGGKDGAQIPVIQFDELQEFSLKMLMFMFTRNRSTAPGIPRIMRAYFNPDPDGAPWLSEALSWYWDPDTGYAIPERSGVVRWFHFYKKQFHWADSREELLNAFPDSEPISATFIKSLVTDNPILIRNNPDYIAGLMAQDEIIREIKLHGNFKIRVSKGSFFNRAWMPIVESSPYDAVRVRYYDFAGTSEDEAEQKGTDPDYTRSVKLARCNKTLQCFVEDVNGGRLHPRDVRSLVFNTARSDGDSVKIRIELEPGSHTLYVENEFTNLLAGYDVAFIRSGKSKTIRASAVSAQAKARNVCVKRASWNEEFFTEIEMFPKKGVNIHDDQVDALSGAFNELALIDPESSDEDIMAAARNLSMGLQAPQTRRRFGR